MTKTNLTNQTKFRLDEIRKIENHFIEEINQTKQICSCFRLHRQNFSCFKCKNWRRSICSFTSIVGAPVGIRSASFTLFFSLITGITKRLLNITRKKKKKHDKILILAKSKLNIIETLTSQDQLTWK